MGLGQGPVTITRLRRQNSATSAPVVSAPAATASATTASATNSLPATSNLSSVSDQSTSQVASTASSDVPTSTFPSSSAPSSSPSSVNTSSGSVSSIGSSSSQAPSPSSVSSVLSSTSGSSIASSSFSSSQSASSSISSSASSSSTTQSTTPTSSISSTLSSTEISSTASSTTTSTTSSPTSTSSSSSDTSTPSTSSQTPTSSGSSASITTITSSIVTTISGHKTTIATTFPTTLNSPPASPGTSPGQRTGIIAGSAIGASLLALLVISGIFVIFRRRTLRKKIALEHRMLPTPRSALLADEDAFDLADGSSRPMADNGGPQLLRPRGLETGSIFHEGVWPPPGERSRLEDPLLASSTVDLTSIVDDIMGTGGDQHGRSISADTTRSDVPLLANMSPERNGESIHHRPGVSSTTPATRSRLAFESGVFPSEKTPLIPSGHERQFSSDSSPDASRSPPPMTPAAGPSAGAATSAAVERGKSSRSAISISTTGSSEITHLRGGPAGMGFGLGSLVVVNNSPESTEQEQPLVDLTPIPEDDDPREIPPLYHTIPRNASDTHLQGGEAGVASHPPQSPASPPTDVGRAL